MPTTLPLAVVSDIHLGTRASRAEAFLAWLEGLDAETLVINGDLCDVGVYWRNRWNPLHQAVVERILTLAAEGMRVVYLIGNHDAPIRRFAGSSWGGVEIATRLRLDLDGEHILFVHGDCLDERVGGSRWLRAVGGWSYERLLGLTCMVDGARAWCGLRPSGLATSIKHRMPGTAGHVNRFAEAAVELANDAACDTVVVGHIHVPQLMEFPGRRGPVRYANSGDWVEHCTWLERRPSGWTLRRFDDSGVIAQPSAPSVVPMMSARA